MKPKRAEFPSEIDFVTALTVEECLEQLERGPRRASNFRLAVRREGKMFRVEALGNSGAVLMQLNGYLRREKTGTKVMTELESRYIPRTSLSMVPIPVLGIPFFLGLFMIVAGDIDIGLLANATFFGAAASAIWFGGWYFEKRMIERLKTALRDWLYEQLYILPKPKE